MSYNRLWTHPPLPLEARPCRGEGTTPEEILIVPRADPLIIRRTCILGPISQRGPLSLSFSLSLRRDFWDPVLTGTGPQPDHGSVGIDGPDCNRPGTPSRRVLFPARGGKIGVLRQCVARPEGKQGRSEIFLRNRPDGTDSRGRKTHRNPEGKSYIRHGATCFLPPEVTMMTKRGSTGGSLSPGGWRASRSPAVVIM